MFLHSITLFIMIGKLYLNDKEYQEYILENTDKCVDSLNRINVFIGQNNSGKSRFLRKLFSDSKFEFDLKKSDFKDLVGLINEKYDEVKQLLYNVHVTEADQTLSTIEKVVKSISGKFKIDKVKNDLQEVKNLSTYYITLKGYGGWSNYPNIISGTDPSRIIPNINRIGYEISNKLNQLFSEDFDFKFERIYIPILRGLRPIQLNQSLELKDQLDNYKERTFRDYFQNSDNKQIKDNLFTGLSLYEDTKKLLLGNKNGRDRIKKFEDFLSKNFFDNAVVTLIPDINNDVLLIGIGREERPVYELGDGIQSLIILLYPLFFNQDKNLLIFIEEPETSMHPGLQRLFIETLMQDQFKSFQYFISTHSNHFLDITLDLDNISIYTFNKIRDKNTNEYLYHIQNSSNSDIRILDLIGVRNSSVFLSNCTIWVEGITDRLYLKKYLDIYQEWLLNQNKITLKFKEDSNYAFIEYGGGNIVHWSFTNELGWDKIQASRISSKIFVVVDKDSSEEKPYSEKGKRISKLKESLGSRFQIVDGREIENTLSEETLIATVMTIEKKNSSAVSFDRKKIKIEKYQNKKLGDFIESNFINLKRKFKAESGTIYCKLEFCKTSIELIKDFSDLSESAKNLTAKIYEFIKESNLNL
jgi:predicted ATP-dependent endonuclease of OLD family